MNPTDREKQASDQARVEWCVLKVLEGSPGRELSRERLAAVVHRENPEIERCDIRRWIQGLIDAGRCIAGGKRSKSAVTLAPGQGVGAAPSMRRGRPAAAAAGPPQDEERAGGEDTGFLPSDVCASAVAELGGGSLAKGELLGRIAARLGVDQDDLALWRTYRDLVDLGVLSERRGQVRAVSDAAAAALQAGAGAEVAGEGAPAAAGAAAAPPKGLEPGEPRAGADAPRPRASDAAPAGQAMPAPAAPAPAPESAAAPAQDVPQTAARVHLEYARLQQAAARGDKAGMLDGCWGMHMALREGIGSLEDRKRQVRAELKAKERALDLAISEQRSALVQVEAAMDDVHGTGRCELGEPILQAELSGPQQLPMFQAAPWPAGGAAAG